MEERRNVFVLFAPGLGGNHLANMIASDPYFRDRCSLHDYINNTNEYAHFYGIRNLQNTYHVLNYYKNVLCGHLAEFILMAEDRNLFYNKEIVIISIPTNKKSIAYKRFHRTHHLHDFYIKEQTLLYYPETIEKLFDIDSKKIKTIDSEKLFSEDGCIEELKKINYDINETFCKSIHKIWFDKIAKSFRP